ncbi:MAG TPA: GFA family protein [Allosphingosinicella sp.]|nr:GFA family protein [Allosphingosinicella sp.]
MTTRTARCSCGGLAVAAAGEPARNSVCHCLKCKRRTGSAFSWNATYAEAQVEISGEHSAYTRISDRGSWVRHHYCPECGTRMFYEIELRPGMVSIPVGAFADPGFPAPAVEVFGERRCAWIPELAPLQE